MSITSNNSALSSDSYDSYDRIQVGKIIRHFCHICHKRENTKMGNRKRIRAIHIRVTAEEKQRIERCAALWRLSVSEYLRRLACGKLTTTPQGGTGNDEGISHTIDELVNALDRQGEKSQSAAIEVKTSRWNSFTRSVITLLR